MLANYRPWGNLNLFNENLYTGDQVVVTPDLKGDKCPVGSNLGDDNSLNYNIDWLDLSLLFI